MSRLPNFKNDNEIGKIGEALFKLYAETHKPYTYIDVSDDQGYQALDIDFVLPFNSEYDEKRILLENNFTKDKENRILNWVTVEVKTDTRTFETRNFVYEILSHDNPGCLARSLADFVFYVAIEEKTREIKEAWMINLQKWRTWIRETSPGLNTKGAKNLPIRLHNFNTYRDKCLNFLCNVETLVEEKIAVKVNLEKLYESRIKRNL